MKIVVRMDVRYRDLLAGASAFANAGVGYGLGGMYTAALLGAITVSGLVAVYRSNNDAD